ncbi:IS3 family transposase [Streptomyces sp. NPDC092307]|uniref:IS3 family transposase n=1 Tax=Streptomyces sp. NPDC092307 TaxID=3366013 RepID=UPI003814380B
MTSRFQFVDDHRSTFEVKRLCQVLEVNRSGYYKWRAGAEARAARQREELVLAGEIRKVHTESGGTYGSPRVTAELREKGHLVNEKRVARVMRTHSVTGIRLRRRVRTTLPDPSTTPVADLFRRDFTAPEPGRKPLRETQTTSPQNAPVVLARYNTGRRHSANGHLNPTEYERRHHTNKLTLAA